MDRTNRITHKTGSGAPASASEIEKERRERLTRLAMETMDISKDPYISKNHLGQIECKLCLTIHQNEESYLSHTQGRKHQTNLARRAAKEKNDSNILPAPKKVTPRKTVKIGRPGYRVTKLRTNDATQKALLFEIQYPEIEANTTPRYRIMSAYEQRIDAPDNKYQYLLFAAEPYETIGFKVPNEEIDRSSTRFHVEYDEHKKQYLMQFYFKVPPSCCCCCCH
eukprot:GHVU01230985.1.p1 GENE.GHVU01230985.1~~GHVU01230985.1.p1  ORF type:complete len:223 (+),score=32.69 GHVU01230985.1:77-745(+)